MPESTTEKALRLLRERKVKPATTARVYVVEGDHDHYVVVLADHLAARCDCPAHGICSHVLAVSIGEHNDAITSAEEHYADLSAQARTEIHDDDGETD